MLSISFSESLSSEDPPRIRSCGEGGKDALAVLALARSLQACVTRARSCQTSMSVPLFCREPTLLALYTIRKAAERRQSTYLGDDMVHALPREC
jgi:hypothetical protein